jgi:hypothetical protein
MRQRQCVGGSGLARRVHRIEAGAAIPTFRSFTPSMTLSLPTSLSRTHWRASSPRTLKLTSIGRDRRFPFFETYPAAAAERGGFRPEAERLLVQPILGGLLAVLMVLIFDRIIPANRQPAFLAESRLRPILSMAGQQGLRSLPPDVTDFVDQLKRERGI